MKGVNKAIILGVVGKDPEVKSTRGNNSVCSLSLATNESWKDKQTGEKVERTEWHRVQFFGRLADVVGEYVHKGDKIYIEGRLRTDKYTDRQGVEKYTTYIIADEMQMLGNKGGEQQRSNNQQRPQRSAPRDETPPDDAPFPDDDIPF